MVISAYVGKNSAPTCTGGQSDQGVEQHASLRIQGRRLHLSLQRVRRWTSLRQPAELQRQALTSAAQAALICEDFILTTTVDGAFALVIPG
jgi:hypothetical protein